MVVGRKGQARVRAEGRKNVHALIRGFLMEPHERGRWRTPNRLTYNPYKNDTFVDAKTGEAILWAKHVVLNDRGVFYGLYSKRQKETHV